MVDVRLWRRFSFTDVKYGNNNSKLGTYQNRWPKSKRHSSLFHLEHATNIIIEFLPRCMQCRRGLAMRILSVCLSVCRTRTLWQNGRKVGPDYIPYKRTFSLVFWEEEWLVGGGATSSAWNFGSTDFRWSEIADFQPIIACSSLAVTPSEKSSINANRKSTTRFPMNLRWPSYVAPKSPKRVLKKAKRPIWVKKIGLRLKKVCYKVSSGYAPSVAARRVFRRSLFFPNCCG